MGSERARLDDQELKRWSHGDDHFNRARANVWGSVDSILSRAAPYVARGEGCTGLALGYVQSGKTTSITALMAAAHESGYKIIIGLVATNDILLTQNAGRILERLGISKDGSDVWSTAVQDMGWPSEEQLIRSLEVRQKTTLIMVLKNSPQINKISAFLEKIDTSKYKVLIVDDEVDQVGLNINVKKGTQSGTNKSIVNLRKKLHAHLYIGYTATPYANLLLTPDDSLAPDFVEVLIPGEGYTGGRKFFVEQGDLTFRDIGAETLKKTPLKVPPNLEQALATYLVGSAMMFCNEIAESCPFTSMLINPHRDNIVQDGYKTLLQNQLQTWHNDFKDFTSISQLPKVFENSYKDLINTGVNKPVEKNFIDTLKYALNECEIWMLNQTTSKNIPNVLWKSARLHILIGAQKLDRGFTVEGLTVTYMSRKESAQIDTMQQRSRAYGYRPFMKYCRIFTTTGTRKVLTETVTTEEDLREQLYAWIQSGRNFKDWSRQIGFIIGAKSKATRDSVVKELITRNLGGWHYLLKCNTDEPTLNYNENLIQKIGLESAPKVDFGNQRHRVVDLSNEDAAEFIMSWHVDFVTQSQWDPAMLRRTIFNPPTTRDMPFESLRHRGFKAILISEESSGEKRTRQYWSPTTGLKDSSQIMQGRNAGYPGDSKLFTEDTNVIQIHKIQINPTVKNAPERQLYFLAIKIGSNWKNVRRGGN